MFFIKRVVICCLLFFCFTCDLYGFSLKVITEDFAPFNYMEDGEVVGFTTEIVQGLLKKTGVQVEGEKILLWPWKRAYLEAIGKDNVLLFTTTRTPEREKLFKWVGPIYPREQWMFKLKSRKDIQANSLEEAKKYMVAEVEDSANFQTFVSTGFDVGENLIIVTTWESKIKMMLSGRVDLASWIPLEMAYRLRQLKKSPSLTEKLFLASGDLEYFLAFSLGCPDDIVDEFQKAFDEMRRDGRYQEVLEKYMK